MSDYVPKAAESDRAIGSETRKWEKEQQYKKCCDISRTKYTPLVRSYIEKKEAVGQTGPNGRASEGK